MDVRYYLVSGTMRELQHIAHERNINPKSIRLIQRVSDIYGFRGGEIILGYTGILTYGEFEDIVGYARTHDIKLP
jgi:hypothetical protein